MLNGKKVKLLRKGKGYTQKELGELIGASSTTICYLEGNKRSPDIETLENLSHKLETTPNYLLDFDVEATLTINEEIDTSYNQDIKKDSKKTIYISNDDLAVLNELKKYDKLKNQIYSNPSKWLKDINKKFN